MSPPHCDDCGYVFNVDEPRAPGRCPLCRSERVVDPRFKVAPASA
ncbi:MAG: hypothetical protein ACYDDF_12995 [Thermoplasmatota archaeon]